MSNDNKTVEPTGENAQIKAPLWQRSVKRVGMALVNVLSGTFNVAVLVGAGAIYCAEHGDNPLDGFNNIMTDSNIQQMEEKTVAQAASNYYPEFIAQKQFTFYGDSNHTEGAIREYFFGAENATNIIEGGASHVFIEYPDKLQYLVDDLQSGALNRDEFIRDLSSNIKPLWWNDDQTKHYHGLMADMILTLDKAHVQMHFTDPGLGESGMKQDSKALLFEMAGVIVKEMEADGLNHAMSPLEIFIATQKFVYGKVLADPEFEKRLEALYADFFEQRLGVDNDRIAAKIQSIAGDERAVILYGAAHIMRENDLDEILGADKTQSISLYKGKANYADFLMGALYSLYLPQTPQNIHIIDGAVVYTQKSDASNIGLAHMSASIQPLVPSI
jgi:hypothetical protein